MFIIIYCVIGEDKNGDLHVSGPYFYEYGDNFEDLEHKAKILSSQKSKNQIIPWIFKLEDSETISDAMIRIKDTWFKKFKCKIIETHQTVQRNQINISCPFINIKLDDVLKLF